MPGRSFGWRAAGVAGAVALALVFVAHRVVTGAHNACEMSYSSPAYEAVPLPLPLVGRAWPRGFVLRRYFERPSRAADACGGVSAPVLFVPGHLGSYEQGRSLASALWRRGGCPQAAPYVLDFGESPTCLLPHMWATHADLVAAAVEVVSGRHGDARVLLVGHSMGGAMAMLAAIAVHARVLAVVTIGSPLTAAPVVLTGDASVAYGRVNHAWRCDANASQAAAVCALPLVALVGGVRDFLAWPPATSPPRGPLHEAIAVRDIVGADVDHNALMWCGQVVSALCDGALAAAAASGGGAGHNGTRVFAAIVAPLHVQGLLVVSPGLHEVLASHVMARLVSAGPGLFSLAAAAAVLALAASALARPRPPGTHAHIVAVVSPAAHARALLSLPALCSPRATAHFAAPRALECTLGALYATVGALRWATAAPVGAATATDALVAGLAAAFCAALLYVVACAVATVAALTAAAATTACARVWLRCSRWPRLVLGAVGAVLLSAAAAESGVLCAAVGFGGLTLSLACRTAAGVALLAPAARARHALLWAIVALAGAPRATALVAHAVYFGGMDDMGDVGAGDALLVVCAAALLLVRPALLVPACVAHAVCFEDDCAPVAAVASASLVREPAVRSVRHGECGVCFHEHAGKQVCVTSAHVVCACVCVCFCVCVFLCVCMRVGKHAADGMGFLREHTVLPADVLFCAGIVRGGCRSGGVPDAAWGRGCGAVLSCHFVQLLADGCGRLGRVRVLRVRVSRVRRREEGPTRCPVRAPACRGAA